MAKLKKIYRFYARHSKQALICSSRLWLGTSSYTSPWPTRVIQIFFRFGKESKRLRMKQW